MTSEELRLNKLELLGKLVAGLGHELRNPLSAVKLNLDYMEMFSDELAPDIIESIHSSKESIDRIHHLIETMLSFARVKSDESPLPVERIIQDTIDLSIIRARSRNIKIASSIEQNVRFIRFLPNKLMQILLNLISNSIDACSEGNNITIGAESKEESSKVYFFVEDDGTGIPEEDLEKIFDEFFTTKPNGNGIGLYVCRSLVEELGGKLSVESKLGKGSKFIIELKSGDSK